MHELFYINQRKFYFSQFNHIDLLKYEKKYKNQGPFYTNGKLSDVSVISDGACLALVLYILSLYEKNIKFGVSYFYKSCEKAFKNKVELKKIMPEIYFWMGFQEFAYDKFYQKLNSNFVVSNNIINNYFINNYITKNKDQSEIIHKLFILKNNLNWKYLANFVLYNSNDFRNKIFEHTRKPSNSSLCFSIGINCKNLPIGHQICLMITPHIKDKFILFDPNFGMYIFQSIDSIVKAIFDFSISTFKEKNIEDYKFFIKLLLLEH